MGVGNMRAVLAVLLVLVANGCAQLRPLQVQDAGPVGSTLAFMVRLGEADEATLERIGQTFEPLVDTDARPGQTLRHALWLSTPGHPGHDPESARRELRALLADPAALDDDTRALVRVYLLQLDRRIQLYRANVDLSGANRELREQIEALTDLEREMGENGDDGQ